MQGAMPVGSGDLLGVITHGSLTPFSVVWWGLVYFIQLCFLLRFTNLVQICIFQLRILRCEVMMFLLQSAKFRRIRSGFRRASVWFRLLYLQVVSGFLYAIIYCLDFRFKHRFLVEKLCLKVERRYMLLRIYLSESRVNLFNSFTSFFCRHKCDGAKTPNETKLSHGHEPDSRKDGGVQ